MNRTLTPRALGPSVSTCLAAALVALATLVMEATAATYKWVDEKGVVHYTDKMPPEAVNRGNVQLSKEGIPLKKVDPPPTPEQQRAREQDEERRRSAAKQQEESDRRDRALLASYTSEKEIDLARARALGTIDNVLQSVAAYTERINRRKAEVQEKMATFKNRPVPPVLEREYESLNEELERQAEVVAAKRKEAAAIAARYDGDKARYRELVAARAQAAAGAGLTPTSARK